MTPGEYQRRMSSRLLLTTLWATLLLLAVEVLGGWANKSLTLLSESLHTLVDGFSTILSLMALNSPQRAMGREVWGHGRTEVAGTLMLCAFLGFTGVSLLLVALQQVFQALAGGETPFPVAIEPRVLQFTAAMVILNSALGVYSSYQARVLENLPLQLNTEHFLKDVWFSIVMLVVLLAVWQNQLWLDAVYAIALLLTLARSLWRVLNAQLPLLLRPTAIAPEAIAAIVGSVQGITHCMSIRSRGMVGRQVWVELRLAIHPEFWEARQTLGDHIEALLRQTYGPLRANIEYEPARTQQTRFADPQNPYDPPAQKGPGWG
jgi:cation diffusion facilitator family transporter